MRRGIAVSWHALSFLLAAVLYFIFVLPRWWELTGDIPHGVGTTLRIVTGALIGLTALPVVFNLLRMRKPEFGTPQLALTLRVCAIVAHVLAGVLIVGAAVTEIWVSLEDAGQWLFGVYGAAAAIATLGAAAFYLAFVAEMPPPPPKPLKSKKSKAQTPEPEKASDEESAIQDTPVEDTPVGDTPDEDTSVEDATPDDEPGWGEKAAEPTADGEPSATEDETSATEDEPARTGGRLRNRRPSGKSDGNRRRPGRVAVSDD